MITILPILRLCKKESINGEEIVLTAFFRTEELSSYFLNEGLEKIKGNIKKNNRVAHRDRENKENVSYKLYKRSIRKDPSKGAISLEFIIEMTKFDETLKIINELFEGKFKIVYYWERTMSHTTAVIQ